MPWSLRMLMISLSLMLVFQIYLGARFVWAVNSTNLQKQGAVYLAMGVMEFLFILFPLLAYVSYLSGNDVNLHNYPGFLIYLFWFGFIFSSVMISWMLFLDISVLGIKFVLKINPPQLNTFFAWIILGISALVFAGTGAKLIWDTSSMSANRLTAPAESIDPLTIVHVSDLHADKYTSAEKMERYMAIASDADPDLVVFTGDLVSYGRDYIEAGAAAFKSLNPAYGIFAVLGDHDYWSGEEEIVSALEAAGVTVLRDQNAWIPHGDGYLKLTGFTEIYSTRPQTDKIAELLEETKEAGPVYSMVLTHQASERLIRYSREAGVNQILAGHTHGGQMRIPFFFYRLSAALRDTPYINGYWWFDKTVLNVNSGLGFTLAPVRYNAAAEVSIIEVK